MTTLNLTTRLVTVPRHRDSLTHAIEKSGLNYVNSVVSCYEQSTGLTDVYEITGVPRVTDDIHHLDVTLTANEYIAMMHALSKVTSRRTLHTILNEVERMELDHLRTLLAEAAAPDPKDTT